MMVPLIKLLIATAFVEVTGPAPVTCPRRFLCCLSLNSCVSRAPSESPVCATFLSEVIGVLERFDTILMSPLLCLLDRAVLYCCPIYIAVAADSPVPRWRLSDTALLTGLSCPVLAVQLCAINTVPLPPPSPGIILHTATNPPLRLRLDRQYQHRLHILRWLIVCALRCEPVS